MLNVRLAALRKETKVNQTEMAKRLGIARTTYAMYKQGNRNPDYETLNNIANYFDLTTDYLLGRSDYPSMTESGSTFANKYRIFESNDEERDFAMNYEDWSDEEKEEMREFVRFKMEQRKKNVTSNWLAFCYYFFVSLSTSKLIIFN